MIDDIKGWLVGLGIGLVNALGTPSPKVELVADPRGTGSVALVRDGYALQRLPGQDKLRRTHTFDDLESFAAWLKKHADPKSTELLFDRHGVVRAALAPSHISGDVVLCGLHLHPRLERWTNLFKACAAGQVIAQRDFHRFIVGALEDFPAARSESGEDLGSAGQHLGGQLLRVEVIKGSNLTVQLDELGVTRLSGNNNETVVTAKLPPKFQIRVPWFIGAKETDEYEIEVFLTVHTPDKGVGFSLAAPALEVVRHAALTDAVVYLRELLGEEWLVGLGSLATQPVPQLAGE